MVSIGLVEAFRFSWDRRVILGTFRVFTYFCRVQLGLFDGSIRYHDPAFCH